MPPKGPHDLHIIGIVEIPQFQTNGNLAVNLCICKETFIYFVSTAIEEFKNVPKGNINLPVKMAQVIEANSCRRRRYGNLDGRAKIENNYIKYLANEYDNSALLFKFLSLVNYIQLRLYVDLDRQYKYSSTRILNKQVPNSILKVLVTTIA